MHKVQEANCQPRFNKSLTVNVQKHKTFVQISSKSDVWSGLRKLSKRFRNVYIKMFLSKLAGRVGVIAGIGCTFHCIFEYVCDFVVCSGRNFIHESFFSSQNKSYDGFFKANPCSRLFTATIFSSVTKPRRGSTSITGMTSLLPFTRTSRRILSVSV